ncbi:hypothetical protein OS242_10395 [Tumebacillus sp. DT12]|uniref:Uncharacterized protein n=1 Tax=Tumebacillus lacus TaxID=2995335 RepID=A0ABT3X0E5_9BACL|nr:hypothetical protein [Tumebacillus lacus]MCX7570373.1 hypothetical protein [Tumebacillus lacus]
MSSTAEQIIWRPSDENQHDISELVPVDSGWIASVAMPASLVKGHKRRLISKGYEIKPEIEQTPEGQVIRYRKGG